LWSAVARVRCAQACTALANRLQSARGWSAKHIQVAYRWRKPILAGLGAGFTVALASSLLGPLAGALLCAASVFTLVVVASVLASRPASPSAH
jgi:hypothetical protein